MKLENIVTEACVETLSEAIKAEKNGAQRLELCSNLNLDGLTPEFELTRHVLEKVSIPVKVMIRPRGGDFVYNDQELQQMVDEIQLFKKLKIKGVVFGVLDDKKNLNLEQIQMLTDIAYPLEVTIHKAIDETPDILKSVSELTSIKNITSILTSGGQPTAHEGKDILIKTIQLSGSSVKIIPAGKITNQNLLEIHNMIGAQEYHGRRIVGSLD